MAQINKRLVILDSNAIIHRSFHALPDFRAPNGKLVNAVYGFTTVLLKVIREFEPQYIAATFDVAGPTFRDKEYEEYKAKRVKAPDELYEQMPIVKDVLRAFNVSIYEKEGFEADDVIGTIASLIKKRQAYPKVECIIVSGDLDTLQLVDADTKVYTMRKGLQDTILYDVVAVKKRFGGVSPNQMADYKGLRGDPSDNIPGITGIGEKTAIELLLNFKTIDKIYEDIDKDTEKIKKLKPKLLERLKQYKDQALFSRELATIRRDVPIDFVLKDLMWRNFNKGEVEGILKDLGFRSILSRLPDGSPLSTSPKEEQEGNVVLDKIDSLYREGILSEEICKIEKDLAPIIKEMEEAGIKLDKDYFFRLGVEVNGELGELEKKIYKICRAKFNINSPQQLSQVLFSSKPNGLELSARGLKKTPGGVTSTAADELEKLSGKHEVVNHLLKYRELQKLFSTYIKPLPQIIDSKGRLHTTFNQFGATTGRISSSDPNLQNIPVRGGWGTEIRKGFIPEKGSKFVSFDYSQMELRIAAHISGDFKMQDFFQRGEDIHVMTAAEVFGIEPSKVTKDMRFRAKSLNFGVLYGMGVGGFAKSAGVSRNEAQMFIEDYFQRFPKILEYIEDVKESVRKNGYSSTLLGRKRFIPDINSSAPQIRAQAERMAINHPIQGTAADIIKKAMVEVRREVPVDNKCRMLLQIHDELLFEIANDKIKERYDKIKDIMEDTYNLSAPLKVNVYQGSSWGELNRLV